MYGAPQSSGQGARTTSEIRESSHYQTSSASLEISMRAVRKPLQFSTMIATRKPSTRSPPNSGNGPESLARRDFKGTRSSGPSRRHRLRAATRRKDEFIPAYRESANSYLHCLTSVANTAVYCFPSAEFGSTSSSPSMTLAYSGPICCARLSALAPRASRALLSFFFSACSI